jgi:HEPN domain-containing protein
MQPAEEQARRQLVAQWLQKAEIDLRAAEALLANAPPLLYPSCFHAQQAAEKFLKAFLTWHQVEFPKTHAIGELLDLAAAVDAALADGLAAATVLSPYGVAIRYPGEQPEPSPAETAEAIDLAKTVKSVVLAALPEG